MNYEYSMENINLTIVIAIIGSGFLSTIIVIGNDWIKSVIVDRQNEKKEIHKIKKDIYNEIVDNMDFLYRDTNLTDEDLNEKKQNFLKAYRMMFLYSEDEVVKSTNKMLSELSESPTDDDAMTKKKKKISGGLLILRKHINKNTKLAEVDFMHFS